jgi:hypothetical protein
MMSINTRGINQLDLALAVLLALVLSGVAGCAARQASNPAPALSPDTLANSLAERDRLLNSLQTAAIMEYSGPSGHLKVREQLTLRRPASLRVDAMSPLGPALVVAADDTQIAVFNPSNNTLMRGAANAATLARFTRIPMAPAQAVNLLLGLPSDSSILRAQASSSRTEGTMRVLSYTGAEANYEIGFSDGQLSLLRARDKAGGVTYEAHYSDYRDIGAIKFPFKLDASFPGVATTIRIHYLDPWIDRQIANSTFVLAPGPGTRLIELGLESLPTPASSPG